MAIAEVMYSDQEILQERINRRQVRQNILTGSWIFARRSVTETIRAFAYLVGLGKMPVVESAEDAPITVKENNAQIPGKIMPMPQAMGASRAEA